MSDDLTRLSAVDLAAKVRAREVSCVEVAESFASRIGSYNESLNAFVHLDPELLRKKAQETQKLVDVAARSGTYLPLAGVPVAIKDNISTSGIETTCCSNILKGYIPPYDATVIEKIVSSGGWVIGKTNLDEFAMGSTTETSAYGTSRNPWDPAKTPGGSSGGSAVAVAAQMCPLALGSDTGGSIRTPASFCGIVGYKPTYGRCSRYGLVAFGSSLDQIGPFARNVEDAALLSSVITGHDPMDATSLQKAPVPMENLKKGSLKGLKMAVPKEMFGERMDPGVASVFDAAVDRLREEGVEIFEVSIPSIKFGVTTYYIIAPAEASSNLARFDGVRFGARSQGKGHVGVVEQTRSQGFGHEVKTRIMIGTYALSAGYYDAYYMKAQQVRSLMQEEFNRTFEEFDFVLSPTAPTPAIGIGEFDADPLAIKLLDYLTIPANLAGLPSISLNCGFTRSLPVGLQLMAPVMEDEKMLQAAYSIEQVLPESIARPSMG
jgi:aspartyl-tRNA(Asn)/glutamyl-tRNA(Gln) amidotransferase subunit A